MIYTQPPSELNLPGYRCVGVYYDEVSLTDANGHGHDRPMHVASLNIRSGTRTVVAAKFEFRPGTAHPSYNTIIASVTGDEYVNTAAPSSPPTSLALLLGPVGARQMIALLTNAGVEVPAEWAKDINPETT